MTKIFIDGGRIFKVLFDVEKIMKKIMQFMTRMTFHMQFFMKKIMQFLNKKIGDVTRSDKNIKITDHNNYVK